MEEILEYKDVKLKPIRKVIAKNMHSSLQEMAQLTLNASFDATNVLAARKAFKASSDEETQKITINDIVLYAVAQVLPKYPELNAHFMVDFIRNFNVVNLGMAVDTPRGLMVPNIFKADSMSLLEISRAAKGLKEGALTGKLDMSVITNGTFTVTNLGAMGVESFTPVINPPQVGILGVCTTVYRVNPEGKVYPAMGLSLTFDHRALDGGPAARFLKDLCDYLAQFKA